MNVWKKQPGVGGKRMSSCVSDGNRKTALKKYAECNEVTSPGGWIGEISSRNSCRSIRKNSNLNHFYPVRVWQDQLVAGFLALWGVASEKGVGNDKFSVEICTLHSPDVVFDLYVNVQNGRWKHIYRIICDVANTEYLLTMFLFVLLANCQRIHFTFRWKPGCWWRKRMHLWWGFSLDQNRKLLLACTALVEATTTWNHEARLPFKNLDRSSEKQASTGSITYTDFALILVNWTSKQRFTSRRDSGHVVLITRQIIPWWPSLFVQKSVLRTSACLGLQWLHTFLCHGEESVNTAETNRIRVYTEVHMHTNTKAYIAHYPDCTHPHKALQEIEKGKKQHNNKKYKCSTRSYCRNPSRPKKRLPRALRLQIWDEHWNIWLTCYFTR